MPLSFCNPPTVKSSLGYGVCCDIRLATTCSILGPPKANFHLAVGMAGQSKMSIGIQCCVPT